MPSILSAEGTKQLHCSSCIKIQERLLFLVFFILKKKKLFVSLGVWGSWINAPLDLGWWCFLPSYCVRSQACFVVLELHVACSYRVIYLSGRKYFRSESKAQSLLHCRLCSIKTSHCQSSAPEETGHAHLSLFGWPADQRQALAMSLEDACCSSRWFS